MEIRSKRLKTNINISSKSKMRVIYIDLDDTTDTESDLNDNQSDCYTSSQNSISLEDFPDLNQDIEECLTDIDMNLVEEILNEKSQEMNQNCDKDNQNVTESDIKQIESYLINDSNDWNECKENLISLNLKSEESMKKEIKKLKKENQNLYSKIKHLTKELNWKTNRIDEMVRNRPKIVCFICGRIAIEKFFCCFRGCYCSQKCKSMDLTLNKHKKQCIRRQSLKK